MFTGMYNFKINLSSTVHWMCNRMRTNFTWSLWVFTLMMLIWISQIWSNDHKELIFGLCHKLFVLKLRWDLTTYWAKIQNLSNLRFGNLRLTLLFLKVIFFELVVYHWIDHKSCFQDFLSTRIILLHGRMDGHLYEVNFSSNSVFVSSILAFLLGSAVVLVTIQKTISKQSRDCTRWNFEFKRCHFHLGVD